MRPSVSVLFSGGLGVFRGGVLPPEPSRTGFPPRCSSSAWCWSAGPIRLRTEQSIDKKNHDVIDKNGAVFRYIETFGRGFKSKRTGDITWEQPIACDQSWIKTGLCAEEPPTAPMLAVASGSMGTRPVLP